MQLFSMRTVTLSSVLLATVGCAPGIDVVEGEAPDVYATQKIHGGSATTEWYHDAVVSLHQMQGNSVYTDPFCTGTLITDKVVLTAGHCLEGMSASRLAIYVGDNPYVDLVSHMYTVDDVEVYPNYSSRQITDDLALVRLDTGVTESVTPVYPLPSSDGFTNSDIGETMNFAGFGTTETGGYGQKLQVSIPLGGFGCSVYGCSSSGDSETQISYRQGSGGPCSGDSGGPMFVERGDDVYVGGITSYGDYYCTQYGVSTRVDAYTSWISNYAGVDFSSGYGGSSGGSDGGSDGGSSGGTCDGFTYSYDGSLSGTGATAYEPDGNYYHADSQGGHEGYLVGPGSVDFDLYLYKYRNGNWRKVATSTDADSEEYISYSGSPGYYLWMVYSYSGSGSYEFCLETP